MSSDGKTPGPTHSAVLCPADCAGLGGAEWNRDAMRNATGDIAWSRWLWRKVLRSGRLPGLAGAAGRLAGRRFGWRLNCGARMIIDRPAEAIQSIILYYGEFDPGVGAAIRASLRPGDVFFDVGANAGVHTLLAATVGAEVHCFEPVPRINRRLRDNLRLNGLGDSRRGGLHGRIHVVEAALGAEEGVAQIHVADRADDGSHSLIEGVEARSVTRIPVRVTTLDNYVCERQTGPPAVVKIDVEGFEAKVLDGALAALDALPGPVLVLETADRLADQIGESAASVLGRLWRRGYAVFQIPDVQGSYVRVTDARVSGHLSNYLAVRESSPRFRAIANELGLV